MRNPAGESDGSSLGRTVRSRRPDGALPDGALNGRSGTILLVEDEAALRSLGERALRRAGWEVWAACCAEDALSMLSASEAACPVLMVSDVALPGMDGAALVRELRRRWPHMPAILVSGYAESRIQGDLLGGEVNVLQKPYKMQALLSLIEAVSPRG
jgi:two-component system cell cycle sensor histidine kinase/response regulator CckA